MQRLQRRFPEDHFVVRAEAAEVEESAGVGGLFHEPRPAANHFPLGDVEPVDAQEDIRVHAGDFVERVFERAEGDIVPAAERLERDRGVAAGADDVPAAFDNGGAVAAAERRALGVAAEAGHGLAKDLEDAALDFADDGRVLEHCAILASAGEHSAEVIVEPAARAGRGVDGVEAPQGCRARRAGEGFEGRECPVFAEEHHGDLALAFHAAHMAGARPVGGKTVLRHIDPHEHMRRLLLPRDQEANIPVPRCPQAGDRRAAFDVRNAAGGQGRHRDFPFFAAGPRLQKRAIHLLEEGVHLFDGLELFPEEHTGAGRYTRHRLTQPPAIPA